MTAIIDRDRLAGLQARERELFTRRHPRSQALFQQARAHMLDGVPRSPG